MVRRFSAVLAIVTAILAAPDRAFAAGEGLEGMPETLRNWSFETGLGLQVPIGGRRSERINASGQFPFLRVGYGIGLDKVTIIPETELSASALTFAGREETFTRSLFSWTLGVRAAFPIWAVPNLSLEPHLGLGVATMTQCRGPEGVPNADACSETRFTGFTMRFGNVVAYRVWRGLWVGADVRFDLFISAPFHTWSLNALVGWRFW